MALAYNHVKLLFEMKKNGMFPARALSIMELGEQNWYGDVPPYDMITLATSLSCSPETIDILKQRIDKLMPYYNDKSADQQAATRKFVAHFELSKLFYKIIFNYSEYKAIDLFKSMSGEKFDLNNEYNVTKKFDVVTNIGTSEHVFNQYMFFKNMHNLTAKGGFMINALPNQGCYDHGFYNYHPTFFFDLADANKYEIKLMVYVDATKTGSDALISFDRVSYVEMAVNKKLSNYSAFFVIYQKIEDSAFATPQQGFYNGSLPDHLKKAWSEIPR